MTRRTGREGGFALAMVVFMLFAAAVAGITGYQIVSTEATLADGNENQEEALQVANAGIQRYIGEHIGVPSASTYAAVGDGSVTVTPLKVAKLNDSTDLYLLTAVGTVTDTRYPTNPATRTVYQYAKLNRRPVKAKAAFMSIQPTISLGNNSAVVDGSAYFSVNANTDCPSGDNADVGNNNSVGGSGNGGNANSTAVNPTGSSVAYTQIATTAAGVISAAGLRWSVLVDPTFPIPYDGQWPNFNSIPADSFPVIRVTGNYTLDRNGRGALIVTGTFMTSSAYTWKGIILAGAHVNTNNAGSYESATGNGDAVQGLVVTGLNGTTVSGTQTINRLQVYNYPCWIRRANLSLAYLSPVSRSTWTY